MNNTQTISEELQEAKQQWRNFEAAYRASGKVEQAVRLHAEKLAEACQDLMNDCIMTNDPFPSAIVRQSSVRKIKAALAAWEAAQ